MSASPSSAAPARPRLRGLGADEYRQLGAMMMAQIKRHDVPSLAAAVAFKVFFSLFPALFAAAGAFALVLTGAEVIALLDELAFVPDGIRDTIEGPLVDFVEGAGGGASLAVVLGILAGLWSASSAAATLIKSLTRINGAEETRGFVGQRLVALAIALSLFLVLVLLVVLLVAGSPLQRMVVEAFAAVELGGAAQAGFTAVRYAAAVAVVVVFFAFVFWIGPDLHERSPFQLVSPGALFGVLGWVALSAGFGIYTSLVGGGGNPAAGLFGGAIVLLLWLHLSMLVLLLGAQLNAGLSQLRTQGVADPDASAAESQPAQSSLVAAGPAANTRSPGAGVVMDDRRAGPNAEVVTPQQRRTRRRAALAAVLAGVVAVLSWLRRSR